MTEEIQLKYRWRQTWPEREDDFVGYDGDVSIGRFYKYMAPGGYTWRWFFDAVLQGTGVARGGMCDTAREAAHEIERWYDAVIAQQGKLRDPE